MQKTKYTRSDRLSLQSSVVNVDPDTLYFIWIRIRAILHSYRYIINFEKCENIYFLTNHWKDIFKKKLNKICGTRRKFCWVKSVNVCLLVESFWTFFHCVDPDSHYSEYWSLPIHKEAEYGTILYPDPQHCYIFVTFCRMYTDPVLVLDFQSLYPSIIIGTVS